MKKTRRDWMKYIIFDFDGTLVDSTEALVYAWNVAAKKFHFTPLCLEDVPSLLKYTIKERAAMYNFPLFKLPIIMPGIYKIYREQMALVTVKEGVRETIEHFIHEGYQVAVISSNKRTNIEAFFKQHHIEGIEEILTSSKIFGKDSMLKKFMKEQNIPTQSMLYIGDEMRDIEACHKVNVPVVALSWGYDAEPLLVAAKPTYLIKHIDDLPQIVAQHFQMN